MSDNEANRRTEEVWWSDWFAADFSWEGLAQKPDNSARWENVNEKEDFGTGRSLQSYWRTSPDDGRSRTDEELISLGELITAPDGKLWHVAHVPVRWPDGTVAKGSWNYRQREALDAVLSARLQVAKETVAGLSGASSEDRRAKFIGVIFSQAPTHPDGPTAPLHIDARWSWIRLWVTDNLTIGPSALFDHACLGDIRISYAHFRGHAGFSNALITEYLRLSFATFDGYASFDHAELANADFARSHFKDDAEFRACQFHGYAQFTECRFERESYFHNSRFDASADFSACGFDRDVTFMSTGFKSAVTFAESKFGGTAKFTGVVWPENPGNWHDAFSGATFARRAWFTHSNRVAFSAFNGAHFERGADLPDLTERQLLRAFREEMRLTSNKKLVAAWLAERNAHLGYYYRHAAPDFDWRISERLPWKQIWHTSMEGGCRSLRNAARSNSESPAELAYYRFELLARRAHRSTPTWQKAALSLYESSSACGTSMLQPFATLVAVFFGFGVGFFAWSLAAGMVSSDHITYGWEAASYSWRNIFRPFTAASDELSGIQSIDRLLERGAATEFGVRAAATLESLAAVSLVFLFGLAARRRFQLAS